MELAAFVCAQQKRQQLVFCMSGGSVRQHGCAPKQAVRDEILNIMHRNNIGEKRGTWMEDWHQKLHNNTTPDDVAICEAYLAFLEKGGDNGAYWRVLSDAGGGFRWCWLITMVLALSLPSCWRPANHSGHYGKTHQLCRAMQDWQPAE
jgi:hypothetical protein